MGRLDYAKTGAQLSADLDLLAELWRQLNSPEAMERAPAAVPERRFTGSPKAGKSKAPAGTRVFGVDAATHSPDSCTMTRSCWRRAGSRWC